MKFAAFSIIGFAILSVTYAHIVPLIYQPSTTLIRSPAYTYNTFDGFPYQPVAPLITQTYQPIQYQFLDSAPLTYPNYYIHNFVEHPLALPTPQQPIEIPLASNKPTSTPAPTPVNVPEDNSDDKDSNNDKEDNSNGSYNPNSDIDSTDDSKKDEDDTVAVESAK